MSSLRAPWVLKSHHHVQGQPAMRSGLRSRVATWGHQLPCLRLSSEPWGPWVTPGTSASPPIIDVDPINSMSGTSTQGLTADPIQIKPSEGNPETTGVQAPGSTSTGPSLRHEDIDWTGTPWEANIFDDDEDMMEVRQSILTLNQSLIVSNYS